MIPGVGIVLARGGSKGLPRKNLLPVGGKPCVQWTIELARRSRRCDLVAISTDDPEMLELGARLGAIPLRRTPALAGDSARVDDAAREALGLLAREHAPARNARAAVAILYGNVPVRPEGCVDRAIELMDSTGCDSVQSYQPVGKHHPWWTARVDEAGVVRPWEGGVLNHNVFRRQDLPPAFVPDGGVLVCARRALMLEIPGVPAGPHAFFGMDRRGIVHEEGSVVDVDSRIDLLVADAMIRERAGAP